MRLSECLWCSLKLSDALWGSLKLSGALSGTVVLSLKLAELELVTQLCGQPPLLLLDDVLAELDPMRQKLLLEAEVIKALAAAEQTAQVAALSTALFAVVSVASDASSSGPCKSRTSKKIDNRETISFV